MLMVASLVVLATVVLPLAALGQANYATPYTFTTLAGLTGYVGSADGTNSAARFNGPAGVAVDSAGNVYVADFSNNEIRKVTPAGVVTTVAGLANNTGGADGTNNAARFQLPTGLAVDSATNLYVTDGGGNTIRKVTPVGTNWVVTTLAGLAGYVGSADGTNSAARFYGPSGVAVDTNGNLYVADSGNNTIRKVTPVGTNWVVTTIAGLANHTGSADGTNSAARFYGPYGLVLDSATNLYLADDSNCTIRKVTPVGTNWVVTTLAGLGGADASGNPLHSGSADGTNSAARFGIGLGNVAVDTNGNLYVADWGNDTIRKMTPIGTNWVVTTVAGLTGSTNNVDGTGSAARFTNPNSVALDSAGNLYVADTGNNTIRKGMPANSVPLPFLHPPSLSGGLFGFGITGLPGLAVNIEYSTDLSSWRVAASRVLVGGTNYFYVGLLAGPAAQFYRAHVR